MLADITFPHDYKIVRDSVHGYIRVPVCYMQEIVDTELFQRLRHVEQTSMRPLFPASRHDRFIHSLGVFHLGCRAFESLYRNAVADEACKSLDCCNEDWWSKHYALFTLACLLHDCAHAAFSHTYENYYTLPRQPQVESGGVGSCSRLDAELCKEYGSDERFTKDFRGSGGFVTGAPHERMSALMVRRYFKDSIARVFDCINVFRKSFGHSAISLGDEDFAFIARMIIGCQYKECATPELELRNCFVALLNSPTVDVDGLDYMIRDTYNSGITNRSVDCERLLDSLRLREAVHFHNARVADVLIEGVWLPGSKILLDQHHQDDASASLFGDLNCKFSDRDDCKRFLRGKRIPAHEDQFTYQTDGDLELTAIGEMRSGCEIHANKLCRAVLRHWTGELNGVLCVPMSQLEKTRELEGASATYVLAYGKSSLSVLQSAVDARNTFYQWVYTHPQIVYHSSFLQNYLLKMTAKYLCCLQRVADTRQKDTNESPYVLEPSMPPRRCLCDCPLCQSENPGSDEVRPVGEEDAIARILGIEGFFDPNDTHDRAVEEWMGHTFWRSSDDDLNALFKWVYLHNNQRGDQRNEDIEKYFGEYFSRPRHRAIWKSYGELELFKRKHHDITIPTFSMLRGAGQSMSSSNYVFVDQDDDGLKALYSLGHRGLIAIEARAKLKSLDYAGILVAYGEDTERLVDVLDASTSFTSPEPLMFVFEEKD